MDAGQGPNYFLAISELAKDVGGVTAQVNERVTYKELMAQNTEQRREITSKIDKVEEHVLDTIRQSIDALSARIEAFNEKLDASNQQKMDAISQLTQNRGGNSGGKFAIGSLTTVAASAVGVGLYLLLRSFGVAP